MKYKVIKLGKAQEEFDVLTKEQQKWLNDDYEIIELETIGAVNTRPLGDKIFEIKTKNIRSLFKYQEESIIIIGLIFVKKTQKTPKEILKLAKKRLK